jgi:hypothetical protein
LLRSLISLGVAGTRRKLAEAAQLQDAPNRALGDLNAKALGDLSFKID